jgi:hypothetical protein
MLDAWNHLSLTAGDLLLGWVLRLPRDLTLVVVALLTSALMVVVRYFTTPQDRLRRAAEDGRRLKQLARDAKGKGDQSARQRIKATQSMIGLIKLKAEGLPLLVSLVPVALLATWALFRLDFLPVKPAEPVELAVYTPAATAGEFVHVVPLDGVKPDGGWVRQVQAVTDDGPAHGLATWVLRADADAQPYHLLVRVRDRTLQRELIVGQRIYAAPVEDHGDDYVSEWKREPYRFLGFVPGIDAIGLPGWLIGYVILVVPFTMGLKRAMGVW